jgi:hypothetical protein
MPLINGLTSGLDIALILADCRGDVIKIYGPEAQAKQR